VRGTGRRVSWVGMGRGRGRERRRRGRGTRRTSRGLPSTTGGTGAARGARVSLSAHGERKQGTHHDIAAVSLGLHTRVGDGGGGQPRRVSGAHELGVGGWEEDARRARLLLRSTASLLGGEVEREMRPLVLLRLQLQVGGRQPTQRRVLHVHCACEALIRRRVLPCRLCAERLLSLLLVGGGFLSLSREQQQLSSLEHSQTKRNRVLVHAMRNGLQG